MNKKNKISAFTLTEILVVLVISTIVVGMAFTVLDLVQKNMRAIKENYTATTELQHLRQQLTVDFNRFHHIEYNGHLEELQMKTSADSLRYNFIERGLIRDHDTIPVSIDRVEVFFLGNTISEGEVDAIKIFFEKPSKDFIFIFKINDAKTFFNSWE